MAIAVLVLTSGCGGGSGNPDAATCTASRAVVAPFAFERLSVDPLATDPDITQLTDQRHLVYIPRHLPQPRDQLFVFLPGTGTSPDAYQQILRAAAFAGYRSIGLSYVNDITIFARCAAVSDDPDCSYRARQENQDGVDWSDEIDVGPADAVNNRLVKLLAWLDARQPDEGWNAYYAGATPVWSRIALSGHSQGATQTAFVSLTHTLARAVHFSHIGDLYGDESAGTLSITPWSLLPRATPTHRIYALEHTQERTAQWNGDVFAAIGLNAYGGVVDAGRADPPYDCTHTLSIAYPANNQKEAHNMTALDSAQPLDNLSLPLNAQAWIYMLTAEEQ